jgi:hypothetical protein
MEYDDDDDDEDDEEEEEDDDSCFIKCTPLWGKVWVLRLLFNSQSPSLALNLMETEYCDCVPASIRM